MFTYKIEKVNDDVMPVKAFSLETLGLGYNFFEPKSIDYRISDRYKEVTLYINRENLEQMMEYIPNGRVPRINEVDVYPHCIAGDYVYLQNVIRERISAPNHISNITADFSSKKLKVVIGYPNGTDGVGYMDEKLRLINMGEEEAIIRLKNIHDKSEITPSGLRLAPEGIEVNYGKIRNGFSHKSISIGLGGIAMTHKEMQARSDDHTITAVLQRGGYRGDRLESLVTYTMNKSLYGVQSPDSRPFTHIESEEGDENIKLEFNLVSDIRGHGILWELYRYKMISYDSLEKAKNALLESKLVDGILVKNTIDIFINIPKGVMEKMSKTKLKIGEYIGRTFSFTELNLSKHIPDPMLDEQQEIDYADPENCSLTILLRQLNNAAGVIDQDMTSLATKAMAKKARNNRMGNRVFTTVAKHA